ncbi:protein Wnt-2b-A [Pocillopora verrucosa]|uniref:protein Wnt-2b-A n=1 Tax=Pocillopora verrucosa TaxID=203993 RepID=UPI003341A964
MRSIVTIVVFNLLLGLFPMRTASRWWFISQVFQLGSKAICNHAAGLPNFELCRKNPNVLISIGKGAKLGIEECQQQMKNERWNCSTVPRDFSVFGKVLKIASRETAFVYAITSAGVVHAVAQGCIRGDLKNCFCNQTQLRGNREDFVWSGCYDHIAHGIEVAKLFVDSDEQQNDARAKMNLHNNMVGRTVVKNRTVVNCLCHGPSVSCVMQTCYRSLAPFSAVSRHLRGKYDNGVLVIVDQKGEKFVVANETKDKSWRDSLVFFQKSPDYCVPNPDLGWPGTTGRVCYNGNTTTAAGNGTCETLCCGRGFNTIQVEEDYKCNCNFVWCCDVKCSTCKGTVEKNVCKSPEEHISEGNSKLEKDAETAGKQSRKRKNKEQSVLPRTDNNNREVKKIKG